MIYQNFWKQRSIPTWLALLVLMFGVAGGVLLIQQTTLMPFSRASDDIIPQQVEISNITHRTFTVSWVTTEPTTGLIRYGENSQINFVARDPRDPLSGDLNSTTTHWVTVAGLNPNSSYSFTIQANGRDFDNQGSPYTVTTGPQLSSTDRELETTAFSGTVNTANNTPGAGSLVYLRTTDLSPLSAIVNQSGEWQIDITTARTSDLNSHFDFMNNSTSLELFIQGGHLPNSTISFNINNSQPLPTVTLGQDYDFRSLAQPPTPTPYLPFTNLKLNLSPEILAQQTVQGEGIMIWYPESGESLDTDQPSILGSAPPGTELTLELNTSPSTTETVTTDDRGYWQWTAKTALPSSQYTVDISYTSDNDNQTYNQTREFTVITEASNQLAQANTPTPTTVFEVQPTMTPTHTPTPTLRPTRTPSPTTSALQTLTPTPTPAIPVSGISLPTVALTGIGLVLMGIGVLLVI